ncbi:MAG: alanine--glyoxylate aminotransferase family protein [Clostridium sp.]|jgi:aspartate aminotransferase-like enzyme|uniref:pyridoxal-phosphate-dependent aminotransferase family protein n=1 Tax=Clostridium sp. TaxID=1506 RepID=UPI0025B90C48|nr:alanine--glyoxylate aminotransferase family protein [Clostridium sp.]MCH3965396.1 alanine--glyoxylate aminotransferase family protein [Clostridium sp.]MCI1717372.1 alanine--glyoxylate aminotransferase family protein [Clostridium sp.]MCI1801712.1 alanine--glyoxylate aminotransferase family protein [Clostridium sp.]MCI1815537.1 alanine--glyoxylate aminotransferase family protein [Clostridium sp.]MCI1872440.1 alanine--glyoxylate aminotransferase family protein [Clostridium sp.]
MKNFYIMTPGPTEVSENVRMARSKRFTNPDLDLEFYDFYKETCEKTAQFLNTENEVRILSGEGILGLEAACASLTEKGDRILVIDNGIFGEGFSDFINLYGGQVVFFKGDRKKQIDIEELKAFLEKDSNFKYATVVHCDTPSGVLNDISRICPILKKKGILTVVDSVAAMGGERLEVDDWDIDIVVGASQKCISAPPGLTLLSISKDAFDCMESRKSPIASFYCNLLVWKNYYKDKWFPYTPPVSDILGFRKAIDNILEDKDIIDRHHKIAAAARSAVKKAGLNLYTRNGYSNTVTVIEVPEGVKDVELRKYMEDKYNVMIAGSFGYLEGRVIRIGHMGENARPDRVSYTLYAFQKSLENFGFQCRCDMSSFFLSSL